MAAEGMIMESARTKSNRGAVREYISVMKLGITIANLMATFAGVWVASHGHPHLLTLLYTLLGTAFVVASGASLNNYIDRDIDDRMERTSKRAIIQGTVDPKRVLWMGIILGIVGTLILVLLVNWMAALCGFVGWFMYSYVYTVWLKRTTTLSTVLGGIAGSMPPLIGWAAGSGGSIGFSGWVLFFIFFLWQPPHFLPLAMKRSEEYRAAGIPMLPVINGFRETKQQILRYTAAMVPVSLLLYMTHFEGLFYLIAAFILGAIFLGRAIQGLYVQDDLRWAKGLFKYSLIYLTAMCVILVVGTV